jgi:hypothetical protein
MKVLVFEGAPGEIADLLERMPHLNVSGLPSNGSDANVQPSPISPKVAIWTRERVTEMWNGLYGDQKKLVKLILDKGGKVEVTDAQKHLGFGRGPRIAGVLSCITRNARRITKYKEARFVEDWIDEKRHSWGYRLPQHILATLQNVASKGQP